MAPRPLRALPIVVPTGASGGPSAAIDLNRAQLVGIVMPAAWVAAGITFQASGDGTNYFDLYDDAGAEVALTVVQGHAVGLSDAKQKILRGVGLLKIRSGTGSVPVNQTANRTLILLLAD